MGTTLLAPTKPKGAVLPTLSLKQPWLYCITAFDKRAENRTWAPSLDLLGRRIALHASKNIEISEWRAAAEIEPKLAAVTTTNLVTGAIVATAVLSGVVWTRDGGAVTKFAGKSGRDYDPAVDRWFFGPVVWILEDVRNLAEPVPAKGNQGLWRSSQLFI
ncbi:MAG: hypothetical protein WBD37_11465 [Anderseniella sp.]